MAEINLFVRLVTADQTDASEWLPNGTYFIDTRSKAQDGTALALTAYDSALKAEQAYLSLTAITTWPSVDATVAQDIASLMGVQLDPRTTLGGYTVPYPQDWTMREVLGYIAASCGGNWVITPENKLLLVKLGRTYSMLSKDDENAILFGDTIILLTNGYDYDDSDDVLGGNTNIRRNVQRFQNLGTLDAFTGVKLWWSKENSYEEVNGVKVEVEHAYTAGTDDGRVLEVFCPWATQAMANSILNDVVGYAYQGASAEKAELTPAAELGDLVICNGIAFELAKLDVTFGGAYLPDISSPADEEVDYEYHYESKTERELERRVKLGESYFGFKTSRENGIEVVNIVDGVETTRMILNSNVQAFYNANGDEALYFDPVAGKYKFVGDVTVTGGSLNINNNFIVDVNGNVTTNGNVTLQGANTVIYSPKIFASSFSVFPLNIPSGAHIPTPPNGFNLYGIVDNALYNFLNISYEDSLPPYVTIGSPDGGAINLSGSAAYGFRYFGKHTYMSGSTVAFDNAVVTGLENSGYVKDTDIANFVTATQVQQMIDAAIGGN